MADMNPGTTGTNDNVTVVTTTGAREPMANRLRGSG